MMPYIAHFIGVICWLPPHRPEKPRFLPGVNFTAIARFTSHLEGPVLEANINYSPYALQDDVCFKVRLHYHALEGKEDEMKRLAKYTEILIMDAHKVIAVCRNISIPSSQVNMTDEWTPDNSKD